MPPGELHYRYITATTPPNDAFLRILPSADIPPSMFPATTGTLLSTSANAAVPLRTPILPRIALRPGEPRPMGASEPAEASPRYSGSQDNAWTQTDPGKEDVLVAESNGGRGRGCEGEGEGVGAAGSG